MASILTNSSAMSALQTLRGISSSMETTQGRISSGLKVGQASDNAAYWSIATTMRSDSSSLSAVKDAIGLGAAKVDTAYAGVESVIEIVKTIQSKLVTAQEASADKTKIQGEITQLTDQLKGIVDTASFSGENWLKGANGDAKSVVGSFVRTAGAVSVEHIDYSVEALISTDGTSGILDKQYTGLAKNTITLDVSVGGVSSKKTVEAFSAEDLVKQGALFDKNIAVTGAQAYVKVEGTWVKGTIVKHAAQAGEDQELAAVFSKNFTATEAPVIVDGTTASAQDAVIVDTAAVTGSVNAPTSLLGITLTASTSKTDIQSMLKGVDAALTDLSSVASNLGSISARIDLQENFASKLGDALTKGIGRLVDADMNEESTRLKALQTQQQLAIQALSIANNDSQSILSLFR